MQLKGDVFKRASKVIAWLGLADKYTSLTFEFLEDACRKAIENKKREREKGNETSLTTSIAYLENFCYEIIRLHIHSGALLKGCLSESGLPESGLYKRWYLAKENHDLVQ